ncbi:hypothetical protein ABG768_026134 [Culter alburnus]|uniref:Pyrin domain-containing protein n=1 Tax=Culter alburnus TaxID=194366 RepID=A0AAW2AC03_CULAL
MAVHDILLECLDELDSKEMDLFKWHLTRGIDDFKIPKSRLENKLSFEVVGCMIEHYLSDGAGKLTLLILEKMKMMDLAEKLRKNLGHSMDTLQSKHNTEAGTSQKQERCKSGAEFVDKHRTEMIRAVSLVKPIADDMKLLIGNEKYQIILKSDTTHEQMRKLLDFLTVDRLKEEFYQSLKEHEKFLVEDLEHSG